MVRALLGLVVLGALACQSSAPRFESAPDHLSFNALDGWQSTRQLGSLVLSPPEGSDAKNTIAVRSLPIAGGWAKQRTPERVAAATEQVLKALPQAQVSPRTPMKNKRFVGASFDLTYVPAGGDSSTTVERRHVLWVGKHRIFHVIHTGPVGELHETQDAFSAVVDSIREEV